MDGAVFVQFATADGYLERRFLRLRCDSGSVTEPVDGRVVVHIGTMRRDTVWADGELEG